MPDPDSYDVRYNPNNPIKGKLQIIANEMGKKSILVHEVVFDKLALNKKMKATDKQSQFFKSIDTSETKSVVEATPSLKGIKPEKS